MEILVATTKDLPEIKKLVRECLKEFDFEYSPSTSESDLENFDTDYDTKNGIFLIIRSNRELVATAGMKNEGSGTYKIRKMYVRKKSRNRGYAKALLEHIIHIARDKNHNMITLETSSKMVAAVKLYSSIGFERSNRVPASPRCNITMIKTVANADLSKK